MKGGLLKVVFEKREAEIMSCQQREMKEVDLIHVNN